MTLYDSLREATIRLLVKTKMTQTELGTLLSCRQSCISMWLNGNQTLQTGTMEKLYALALSEGIVNPILKEGINHVTETYK